MNTVTPDKYDSVVAALAELITLTDTPPTLFTDAKEVLEALQMRSTKLNALQTDLAVEYDAHTTALALLQEAYDAMREPTGEGHDIKCNTVMPKIHTVLAAALERGKKL